MAACEHRWQPPATKWLGGSARFVYLPGIGNFGNERRSLMIHYCTLRLRDPKMARYQGLSYTG